MKSITFPFEHYLYINNFSPLKILGGAILDEFICLGIPKIISILSRKIQKWIYSPENGPNAFSRFFETRIPGHSFRRYVVFKIILNDFVTAVQIRLYCKRLFLRGLPTNPLGFILLTAFICVIIALRQMQVRIVTDEDIRVYPILEGNIFNFHRVDYSLLN